MATTMTLLDLRNAVRQRTNMENSGFVTDSELNSYINQSYFEWYDVLVQKYGNNYFISAPYTFTTDGVNQFFALPTDFYKLAGISGKIYGTLANYTTLKSGSFTEMQRLSGIAQVVLGLCEIKYTLTANQIWLAPLPQAGQTFQIYYVPKLTTLVSDSDTVDGISGWTEYIICDAAIKCLQKEESDVSVLEGEKAALLKRIMEAAANRDAATTYTITDVTNNDPYGSGRNGVWGYYS